MSHDLLMAALGTSSSESEATACDREDEKPPQGAMSHTATGGEEAMSHTTTGAGEAMSHMSSSDANSGGKNKKKNMLR